MKIGTRAAAALAVVLALALGITLALLGRTGAPASTDDAQAAPSASSASPHPWTRVPSTATMIAPSGGAKYLGVALPGGPGALPAFASATGTTPGLYEAYLDFGEPFPADEVTAAEAHSAFTLIAWQSQHASLASIAAGAQDAYLAAFAQALKAYAWPVYLDFDHEFNGDWYPWGTQAATPGQFVAAWRHIHDLFAATGVTNVIWVWSPNVVNPVPHVDLGAYWPGTRYVDVVGIVGYYTGQLGEDSYAHLFARTENIVDTFADKPFLITETGAQQGPDKSAWVRNLLQGVEADPRMLGLVYFDYGTGQHKRADWTIEDDAAAMAAWRSCAAAIAQITVATS